MNKCSPIFLIFFILLLFQGCTNSLYQGEINALSSDYHERKVLIYWTKTQPLLGEEKAGPAVLITECSTRRLTFTEKKSGLYFYGDPGKDILANQMAITSQTTICGKVVAKKQFITIKPGPLQIDILCEPLDDDFSVQSETASSAYIKASNTPYTFEITESSSWSLFGSVPEVPMPPKCKD